MEDRITTEDKSGQAGGEPVGWRLVERDIGDGHRLADPARADAAGTGVAAGATVGRIRAQIDTDTRAGVSKVSGTAAGAVDAREGRRAV